MNRVMRESAFYVCENKGQFQFHVYTPGSNVYTDKQNALRRECTFKIEIVLEIGVNIYLKITV